MKEENSTIVETIKEELPKNTSIGKGQLINDLDSGIEKTLLQRIAKVLSENIKARNSDIALQHSYWLKYESDIYNGASVRLEDFYKLTKLTSLVRARAKIQNEFGLFLAHSEVRNNRRNLSDLEKEKAITEKPDYDTIDVFIDESGKNDNYLVLGSVWYYSLSGNLSIYKRYFELGQEYDLSEFHFTKISKNNVQNYVKFIDFIKENIELVSYRAVILKNRGSTNTLEALENLLEILIVEGVNDEIKNENVKLPKEIIVTKDKDDEKRDKICLRKIKNMINQNSERFYNNELITGSFSTLDSNVNLQIQLADLITGAISRRINYGNGNPNHKDIVSNKICEELLNGDNTKIIEL